MRILYKLSLLFFITLPFCPVSLAQIRVPVHAPPPSIPVARFHPSKLSPGTRMFMHLVKQQNNPTARVAINSNFSSRFPVVRYNSANYIGALVKVNNEINESSLSSMGVMMGSRIGNIWSMKIPVSNLEQVSALAGIDYLKVDQKINMRLDSARKATHVDSVQQGIFLPQKFDGKGVVVGIIDGGFDYTQPMFYDTTGTTLRIKRVWNQINDTKLTTQNDILSAQTSDASETHGTHVAGIAAGSGNGTNGRYRGMAPGADLVFVQFGNGQTDIQDGISYIINYAQSIGEPAVINMSLGSHIGPHDGTSLLDQAIDSYSGSGKIIVGAAGNEGDTPLHLSHTFSSDTVQTLVSFDSGSDPSFGYGFIDIWGTVGKSFSVSIKLYNSSVTSNYSTLFYSTSSDISKDTTLANGNVQINFDGVASDINNNKPEMLIYVDNSVSSQYVTLRITAESGTINAWNNSSGIGAPFTNNFPNHGIISGWINGDVNSTVGEIGGTANRIITAGAYVTKTQWTDLTGTTESYGSYLPARGNLAPFSSHGPTADGRVKPDITAPGAVVVSSLNSYDTQYNATSPYVAASTVWNSRTYYFGAFMGTSMATPVVTGIIALMLEQDPTLTPENVKDIFKSNSISDSFTGTIPVDGSETWGWGKINAYADLNSLITKPDPPSITVNGDLEFCPGDSVELSGPTGFKYGWSNGDTSRIIQAKNAGSYTLRVQDTGTGAWSLPSDPVQVTHFSLPAVSIQSAGSTAFCTGGSVLLEAVGDPSNSYEWFLNNIDTHNSTISLSVNSSGIYTVQATDGNSCVNISGAVTVSVSPKPDKPVVTDVNNVLKSDASTGNRWYYNNSLINGATADTIQVIKSGNYYDAVFSNDGCSTNSDTFNIETRPVISVEGALSFCKGDSVILSAPEGYHYQWTSGETTRQIAVKNSGSYAFNITDIYSLTSDNSDTVNITVHDLPAVNLNTRGMVSLCNHDTLSLIAHGPAVNQYQWYRDGESLDNPDSMLQVFSKGSYAALVTDTGMCVNHTDTVTINILELPDVRIINQGPLSFCSGDSVSLLVQSDSSNHFEWYDDGSSLNNSDSLFRVFSSGNYTVAATDSNQCRNYSDTLRVTVNPLPAKPEIASDLNYLITDNTAGIQWFFNHDSIPGAVHDTLVVTQPGNYYSIVMNDSGCYINSDTVNITELGLAERSNTNWLIYPNPAHNFLTVESRFTGPAEIYIIDMNGRLMIKKQVWLTGKDEIDLGRLAGGLYLLTIVREESIYQTKILVR